MALYLSSFFAPYGLCVRNVMEHDFMTPEATHSSYLSSVVPSNSNMAAVRASGVSPKAASINAAACQRYFILKSTNACYLIRFSAFKIIIWQPIVFYRSEAWLRCSQVIVGSCHEHANFSPFLYAVFLPLSLLWHCPHITKKWLSPIKFCTHFRPTYPPN
jgi:hypothetical protein